MCLATVYKESQVPANICMENVMQLEISNGVVVLTDIFGRRTEVKGSLSTADFVGGKVMICPN